MNEAMERHLKTALADRVIEKTGVSEEAKLKIFKDYLEEHGYDVTPKSERLESTKPMSYRKALISEGRTIPIYEICARTTYDEQLIHQMSKSEFLQYQIRDTVNHLVVEVLNNTNLVAAQKDYKVDTNQMMIATRMFLVAPQDLARGTDTLTDLISNEMKYKPNTTFAKSFYQVYKEEFGP